MRFFYTGIFFAALMAASQAFAQSSLLQAGPVTPGHQPMYSGSGFSQPLVQDGGGSNGGGLGVNPSELGITSRSGNGANTPPYASNGNGPNGEHFCMFDAPTTNPTGYHYFCFDPNAQGGGLLDYGSAAGAGTLPLQMIVNGAKYQFPFVISGIVGPGTTTVGDIAIWNNAAGTLLKDISVLPAANGGLGAASLTGILVGAGTSAATAITPGSGVAAALANNADAPGGFSMFASTRAVNIWNYANGVNIGDCTHDAGPALQAAYNALGSNGRITIPALYPFSATVNSCYLILTPVVVGATQSHILLEGDTVLNANIYPTSTSGSTLKNGQTASPMITFTGASSANVESDADSGWGFEHLKFEGNNEGTACLAFPENTSGGRGAWTVAIHDTNFDQCAPAIDAANAWDWNISSNSFTRNGIAAGTGHQVATIYIFNSVNASSIFNSNSWRISNNFFDISKAQGIYSDSSGAGTVNQTMLISSSNHFGPKGYPSIAGCLSRSVIRNNVSEGSAMSLSALATGTSPVSLA